MAIMDKAAFQTLLDRRYRTIQDEELASTLDQISEYYMMEDSDSHEERRGSVGELPTWAQFANAIDYQRFYEQFNVVAVHRPFAQGLRWEREMVDDDLTGIMRGDRYRKLVNSGIITRQQHAARLWNFAASNDVFFYQRSEGRPLASDDHLTRTPGVSTASGFDNLTTVALSPTSYRASRIQQRRFANDQGHITNIIGDCLVVPIDLEPRAEEILYSSHAPDSAVNAINPESAARRPTSLKVCIYWNDVNDWALCNDRLMKENAYWYDRIKMDGEFRQILDFDTLQLKASGYGRWSFSVLDWRWLMFGSVSG